MVNSFFCLSLLNKWRFCLLGGRNDWIHIDPSEMEVHGSLEIRSGSKSAGCGTRMIVDDAITDGEKIAETLARLGIVSTSPPNRQQSTGELGYVYDV